MFADAPNRIQGSSDDRSSTFGDDNASNEGSTQHKNEAIFDKVDIFADDYSSESVDELKDDDPENDMIILDEEVDSEQEHDDGVGGLLYVVDESLREAARSLGVQIRENEGSLLPNRRRKVRRTTSSAIYENPFSAKGDELRHNLPAIHHYRSVNMFSRRHYNNAFNTQNLTRPKLVVLGNGETAKDIITQMNAFEDSPAGLALLEFFRKRPEFKSELMAGCIHLESDDMFNRITFFPGHVDKLHIDRVRFIPLSERKFFTFVSVPTCWNMEQDKDSQKPYDVWLGSLRETDANSVVECQRQFDHDACKFMKNIPVSSFIFLNTLGSILEFPSSQCFHGTIIPAGQEGSDVRPYRDLLILHPLLLRTS